MKKIIFSVLGLCTFFICLCSLFLTNAVLSEKTGTVIDNTKKVSASERNNSILQEISGDSAMLVESDCIYSKTDTIWLSFRANSTSEIASYSIENEGFKVLSHYKNDHDIIVKVKLKEENEYPFVKVKIHLQNGNCPEPEAYGYVENEIISINPYSHIDAQESLNNYLYENGLINERDYKDRIIAEYRIYSQEATTNYNRTGISVFSNSATVYGTVTWKDDNSVIHPLQFALVELYNTGNTTTILSTYTDSSGYYTFSYSLVAGQVFKPYVKIYPAGENVKVLKGDGTEYVYQLSADTNLNAGSSVSLNAVFEMNSNLGQAFQISQPVIIAAKFVKEMTGANIAAVSIRYPYESKCFYYPYNKTIYLTGAKGANESCPHSYASWDMIMHEYGHHVAKQFDIDNSLGGWHGLGMDMSDHYRYHLEVDGYTCPFSDCPYIMMKTVDDCKYWANRLAWNEGWATVFGTTVQKYYSASLSNIATVGDTLYTAYNEPGYNLESPYLKSPYKIIGESDELTVQAALWDMFDSEIEVHDNLSLGYKLFWNLTTGSKAKSYAEFMDYFNANIKNISYISAAGKINAYHNLSPQNVSLPKDSVSTVAPEVTWEKMSFRSVYYNTATYTVKFLNGAGTVLYASEPLSDITFQVPQSTWNNVLSRSNNIYVAVFGGDNNVNSGKYCSELLILVNPNNNLIHNNSTRVIERSVTLAAGEYVDYYITFDGANMFDRVFTTFGSLDTTLTLYDENGNQISYDDDDGYKLNALIHLEQQNGVKYKLRVKFFGSSTSGTFRLVIFRAWKMNGNDPDKFENFFDTSTPITMSIFLGVGEDSSWIVKPSESGNYIIETQTRIANVQDMYIYLFNPRTGEMFYDDNSAGNKQARLTVYLEANQEYFLIITRYNPGATVTGESLINIRSA